MWISKKAIFSALIFLTATLFSIEAGAEKRIGVLLFSEEVRYVESTRGIMDALKEAGFVEPDTIITVEKAGANKAKAAELVQQFAAAKMDLIFTVGTHATTAVTFGD